MEKGRLRAYEPMQVPMGLSLQKRRFFNTTNVADALTRGRGIQTRLPLGVRRTPPRPSSPDVGIVRLVVIVKPVSMPWHRNGRDGPKGGASSPQRRCRVWGYCATKSLYLGRIAASQLLSTRPVAQNWGRGHVDIAARVVSRLSLGPSWR